MVTLIFVTGSVQVETEVVVEEVEVVVVHVTVVLGGVDPQEVRPSKAQSTTRARRPASGPLSLFLETGDDCGRTSVLVPTQSKFLSQI